MNRAAPWCRSASSHQQHRSKRPQPAESPADPEQTSVAPEQPRAVESRRRPSAVPAGDWTQTAPSSGPPPTTATAAVDAATRTDRTRWPPPPPQPTGPGRGAADRHGTPTSGWPGSRHRHRRAVGAAATTGNATDSATTGGTTRLGTVGSAAAGTAQVTATRARAARGHGRRSRADRWRHGDLPRGVRHAVRLQGRGVGAGSRLIARLGPEQVRHTRHPRPPRPGRTLVAARSGQGVDQPGQAAARPQVQRERGTSRRPGRHRQEPHLRQDRRHRQRSCDGREAHWRDGHGQCRLEQGSVHRRIPQAVVFPNGLPSNSKSTQSIDIADVAASNGEPVRIAARRSRASGIPSVLYTDRRRGRS